MRERQQDIGLYYPDGRFESVAEIKARLEVQQNFSPNGSKPHTEPEPERPRLITPLPVAGSFEYWSNRFVDRQIVYKEADPRQTHVEIEFKGDTILNLIGDLHVGSPDTHYHRIQEEAEAIVKKPNSYVLAMGDWVDGFFFNPAQFEQIEQAPEQFEYMRSLIDYFASHKRLLVGWGGDHDLWAKKSGADPYSRFSEDTGAYYMHGIGYITAYVGGQTYKISGAHRHNGFSIYNKAHSAMRMYRDGAEGADICVTAHTHQKGYVRQSVKEFGGKARKVDFISVGPYKASDEYARKKGFADQHPEEMYGQAILLHADRKSVTYFDDILEANR